MGINLGSLHLLGPVQYLVAPGKLKRHSKASIGSID